jgi:hypothetical protein
MTNARFGFMMGKFFCQCGAIEASLGAMEHLDTCCPSKRSVDADGAVKSLTQYYYANVEVRAQVKRSRHTIDFDVHQNMANTGVYGTWTSTMSDRQVVESVQSSSG